MLEDCYFSIDDSVPEDERTIKVFCVNCRNKERPDLGWFWKGSSFGYGPFDFICCLCGHVVYSPKQNNEENKVKSESKN